MSDTDKSLYSLRYNQVTSNLEAFGGGSPQWTQIVLNNVDPQQVPITRLISTTAPLQGGGNLSADRTLSIPQANGTTDGYLSATDWLFFTAKLTSMLNSANIFVGDGSNVAVGVALSGDASLSNTGVLTFNTVNGSVGTFTNTQITVNAKGLITAASSGAIGNLTDIGTDGITITGGIGAVLGTGTSIDQHVSDSTHNGYLSSTDWMTFDAKQPAGNYITDLIGDVSATGPGSTTATLATVNGDVGSFTYASITVNAKGLVTAASSGTAPVTSVSGTVNDISSTGGTTPVLDLVDTAVTPGTYTNTTLTVDAKGRLTAASSGSTGVTSVSGTTNQITSTGGTTPVIAIANPVTFPGAMTAGGTLSMASHSITNLTNGSSAQDAAAFGQLKYFQTVQGTTTSSLSTNSTTYVDTGLQVIITPSSSSHRIKLSWFSVVRAANANQDVAISEQISGGSGVSGNLLVVDISEPASTQIPIPLVGVWIDSPASTSAQTYKLQVKVFSGTANTFEVNRNNTTMVMIAEEIV